MSQYSWETSPEPIRRQVADLIDGLQETRAENLIGVYLHGSLAMGCFNPERSDIDILAVTRQPMPAKAKRRIVELLLRVSSAPAPVEMSVVTWQNLHPWRYPPPFDLHYSESWRRRYEDDLASGAWRDWKGERTDVDLAAHITHLHDRGIPLYGPPIEDVFPAVPRDDYLASILSDYSDARADIRRNEVYGVLNMIRVYRYLVEGRLSSKDDAGVWAMTALPEEVRAVVAAALAQYRGDSVAKSMPVEALQAFVVMVDERVQPLLARGIEPKEIQPGYDAE